LSFAQNAAAVASLPPIMPKATSRTMLTGPLSSLITNGE
jgi:hypothetical protein